MGPARFHCATLLFLIQKVVVRREIRTPAHRSGLRPERSALDHSAILTSLHYIVLNKWKIIRRACYDCATLFSLHLHCVQY